MAKILRMTGTEHAWELDDSVDLEQRAREIAEAWARNDVVGLTARLPGRAQWSFVAMSSTQLVWWSLGEESGFSLAD